MSENNVPNEPAPYWSAPREHLAPIQQNIAYRGLSPRSLENAYVHAYNGDALNMLVEIAVDMPYAITPSDTSSPSFKSSHQPDVSPSVVFFSSPSSAPSVSPSLDEALNN